MTDIQRFRQARALAKNFSAQFKMKVEFFTKEYSDSFDAMGWTLYYLPYGSLDWKYSDSNNSPIMGMGLFKEAWYPKEHGSECECHSIN